MVQICLTSGACADTATPAQYVQLTMAELEAVASYIKGCGRVSVGQLAAKSGSLIQLQARDAASIAAG